MAGGAVRPRVDGHPARQLTFELGIDVGARRTDHVAADGRRLLPQLVDLLLEQQAARAAERTSHRPSIERLF